MAILDVLQFEKERLLVQLRTMDSRLRLERERQDGLQEQIRTHKTNYSRMECKYSMSTMHSKSISIYFEK